MKKVGLVLLVVLILATSAMAATLTIRPDASGARKAWGVTGCSGGASEWDCVDEDPADTSDYLKATGTGKETFTFDDTGLTTENINSVTMYYYGMEHNSNKNRCWEAMTRSSGTDYMSGNQLCVGSSWETVSHTYSTNPATSSAWTVSEVDAIEAGMKGMNPDGGGRVAQVYAVVNFSGTCGDNNKELDEVCDGTDLDGQSCSSQGFDGGSLGCQVGCQAFDTSGCYTNTCSETDNYIDQATQGTTSGNFEGSAYSYTDFCIDSTYLLEYYCGGPVAVNTTINCNGNSSTSCSAGACV